MRHRGSLLADGRVARGHHPERIGDVFYKETRYNLVRLIVAREWVVTLLDGRTFRGETRRAAVAAAMAESEVER